MNLFQISDIEDYKKNATIPLKEVKLTKPFIAHSDKMRLVLNLIRKVSKVPSTVLLIGESGVGKEMVANAIYELGSRCGKPFVKVNCGAIPDNLLESELFGYKKGAFTGADPNGKKGYFLQANHGVLFLDEIAELPLNLQVKLLRVIQEREVVPLGETEPVKLDIQIIAATNKNLELLVEQKLFRQDLYYRLNVVPIHIPPLRERIEDIPYLVDHFLDKLNGKYNKNVTFSSGVIQLLIEYPWYGNVRELENLVERSVIISESEYVDTEFIQCLGLLKRPSEKSHIDISRIMNLKEATDIIEEQLIVMAMRQYNSIKLAANALGISQPTMSRKYQKLKEKLKNEKNNGNGNKDILENELNNQLRSVSIVLATLISIDKIKQLKENPSVECPVYHKMRELLTIIRKQEGKIEWSYIWSIMDGKIINLVADEKLDIKPGEEYIGPSEMMEAVYQAAQGKVVVTSKYTDKYGQWKSSVAPIKDEFENVVAILGVDFSVEYIDTQIKKLKG